jgi:transposase
MLFLKQTSGRDPARWTPESLEAKPSAKGVQMPGNRRARYAEEFEAETVRPARSSPEKSIRQLAYEIVVADQTLRSWVKQAQIDRGERGGLTTEEREELRRLRKENKILCEEREVSKKALNAWCELSIET